MEGTGNVSQLVECLPSVCQDLGLSPSTASIHYTYLKLQHVRSVVGKTRSLRSSSTTQKVQGLSGPHETLSGKKKKN